MEVESLSFNGHKLGQTLRVNEGQERQLCCSPWGCKELDITEHLNNSNNNFRSTHPEVIQVQILVQSLWGWV